MEEVSYRRVVEQVLPIGGPEKLRRRVPAGERHVLDGRHRKNCVAEVTGGNIGSPVPYPEH